MEHRVVDPAVSEVLEKLCIPVCELWPGSRKVTIIGCGHVGSAIAYALCLKNLCSEIYMYDVDQQRVEAEVEDLQVPAAFSNTRIRGGSTMEGSIRSIMCIVTAEARQRPGETREKLLERNMEIISSFAHRMVLYSPEAIILVVSNPVETLTYMMWKMSGFNWNRVIGSGTNLDTARLKSFVSKGIPVHPNSVHATVFGEHGERRIPNLPAVSVAGAQLMDLDDDEVAQRAEAFLRRAAEEVKNSEYTIINNKGSTSWGVAMSVAAICHAIFKDTKEVLPITVCVEGCIHAEGQDTFLSMPCVLYQSGVLSVIKSHLTPEVQQQLYEVASQLHKTQSLVDRFMDRSGVSSLFDKFE